MGLSGAYPNPVNPKLTGSNCAAGAVVNRVRLSLTAVKRFQPLLTGVRCQFALTGVARLDALAIRGIASTMKKAAIYARVSTDFQTVENKLAKAAELDGLAAEALIYRRGSLEPAAAREGRAPAG